MKQFLVFIRKEFYHVFRDRKTLLLLIGLPIMQILLFGFALTNEIKNARIVICDYANDNASYQIIDKLAANSNFIVDKILLNHQQIEHELKNNNAKLAIIFPANFYHNLSHLNQANVQIIADASDPNTANTLTNFASAIIHDYKIQPNAQKLTPYSITIEQKMLYNPELKGAANFVPGVMALVLLLICVMMTAVSIVKEKETGTMEVLLVSPFSPMLVIISKAIPYLVLSIINLTIILLLSIYLLNVPFNGSIALLFAESILLIITSLSLGLLISNVANSQQSAMLVSLMGMMVPAILLTGFMFPLENMPVFLQLLANLLPSKWYYIIVKSVMIKGMGFSAIITETLILLFMAVILLFLSLKNFKTRLA